MKIAVLILLALAVASGNGCGAGGGGQSEADPRQGGLLGVLPPRDVRAEFLDNRVNVTWRSGRSAIDFVVYRREAGSSQWMELGTIQFDHVGEPPYLLVDEVPRTGAWVYGVKARNDGFDNDIVESDIIESPQVSISN